MIEEHCNAMEHNVEHNGSNAENMNAIVRGIVGLRYCGRLIVQHINWTTTQQRFRSNFVEKTKQGVTLQGVKLNWKVKKSNYHFKTLTTFERKASKNYHK